jgi:hypothetical protein
VGERSRRGKARCLCSGLALILLALAGCKGGKFSVQGELQWEDGRPLKELAGFEVKFDSFELKKMARGTIKEDGTFELGTESDQDGVIPGEYVVTVTQPHRQPERPETRNPIVDLDYEDLERTPLRATVKEERNHFVFKLRPIQKGAR